MRIVGLPPLPRNPVNACISRCWRSERAIFFIGSMWDGLAAPLVEPLALSCFLTLVVPFERPVEGVCRPLAQRRSVYGLAFQ
jgi:hypothetical protein